MFGNKFARFCACICFLAAVALTASACGGDTTKEESCPAGQTRAQVNGEEGCFDQCDNGMCGAGFRCASDLCVPESSANNGGANNGTANNGTANNGTANNGSANNGTANNGTANNGTANNGTANNGTANNGGTDPSQYEEVCTNAAELLYGNCITDNCTLDADLSQAVQGAYDAFLNGDGANPGCAETAANDAGFATTIEDFVANNTCDTLSSLRCGEFGLYEECGCTLPSNVGAECTADDQCDGGDIQAGCVAEAEFPGGYCIAAPCPVPQGAQAGTSFYYDGCGTGNVCLVQQGQQGSLAGLCIDGCTAHSECRTGYTCDLRAFNQGENPDEYVAVRACFPACSSNADCGGGDDTRCNTENGACEFFCDGAANPNGGPTAAELCTASGGTCTMDADLGREFCVYP